MRSAVGPWPDLTFYVGVRDMKILHRFGGLIAVAGLAACMGETPTEVQTTDNVDGVNIHRVGDLGLFKQKTLLVADEGLQCETIGFGDFVGGTLSAPNAPLTLMALGVSVDVEIAAFTDPVDGHDCGTGQVLIFDTSGPVGPPDADLILAGQSVTPNLGNVVTHQSCETPGTPNDADVDHTIRFTFPTGEWFVQGYSALDQEGNEGEFIALEIDVATDGTQVGITDITVDNANMVEVVGVAPAASFASTLDFDFHGSGAIDDIVVCKVAERGGEGCTPGYWKQSQHFGSWPVDIGYTFADAFDGFCDSNSLNLRNPESGDICDLTLLEALGTRGGQQNALARHAAAAWLNAGSTVEFKYSQSEVETMVEAALASGSFTGTKDALAAANEAGCPLGRSEL